jgi:hypothetical protein
MDRHVAVLEEITGQPLRAKIYWVRGELFGRRQMAIRGLVLGGSHSPADWVTADHPFGLSVDRHELAHGVVHQIQPPDADPPTLLIEGWAEAHSGMTAQKRAELAKHSRGLWRERSAAGPAQSYLRELTGPEWYRRVDGPVYSVGGALAEFMLHKYGAERFLRLYLGAGRGGSRQSAWPSSGSNSTPSSRRSGRRWSAWPGMPSPTDTSSRCPKLLPPSSPPHLGGCLA